MSWDEIIKIWNVKGRQLKTLEGHLNPLWIFDISQDGKTLATGDYDGQIKLWNINN